MKQLKVGSLVEWKWLGGTVTGRVERVYLKPVQRMIKGKAIKRNGSKDRPAYLVKSDAGNLALKLQTELSVRKAKKKSAKREPCLPEVEYHEADVLRDLDEDFLDAFHKLREFATSLGDQRIYASAKAIMFSRRVCYMFVRPQKKFLEFVFFLPHQLNEPAIFRAEERSVNKYAHTLKLMHADQVEEPLTDWIREAFEAAT